MKLKQIGCILTAAILLAATGCNARGSSSKAGTNSSGNSSSQSNSSSSPVAMTWFSDVSFWTPPTTWSTDPNTVQGAITQNTGAKFEMNIPPQDADTKLSLMMVSGTLPDVITITDSTTIQKLESSGKVWKIDELLQQYDPSSWILKDYPADQKQAMLNRDGAWYAFPSHISSADSFKMYPVSSSYWSDGQGYGDNNEVMFNSSIMDQAGIKLSDLQTETGVLAALKKVASLNLKVNGASVIPLLIDGNSYANSNDIFTGGTTVDTLWKSFGVMPVDKDGNYRSEYLNPLGKEAFQFLNACVCGGYLDPSELTMDNNGVKADIANGRTFCFIGNTANTAFDKLTNPCWVSAGPMLSGTGAKAIIGEPKQATTGWMQTFISKSTKNPSQAAKFLSWMSSPEGMYRCWYGKEGVDFTLDSNGVVQQTKQGEDDVTAFAKTGVQAYWPFMNIAWTDHVTPAPTKQNNPGAIEANTVQCALGKSPNTVVYDSSLLTLPSNYIPANSDLGLAKSQMQNYVVAQISKMVMAKDDATFNSLYSSMVSQLKNMGLEKYDAKINEQVQKNYKLYNSKLTDINAQYEK